ncbi:MAG: hypothetical protein ACT4PK_08760 [Gammaproteobacteria bacterium]
MNARAAALLCLALLSLAPALALAQAPDESQAARETEFDGLRVLAGPDSRLASLGVYFGHVEKDTRPSEGVYVCGGMSRSDATDAANTAATALSNLPDAALRRLGLRYVVVCSGLTESGRSIGGIPVAPHRLLVLDGSGDSASVQHRTLHELYHLLEFRSGGISDSEWISQFGGGYSNQYPGLLRQTPLGSGKQGFATAYGETYPHEDRAELFAWLVLAPRDVANLASRRGDSVLRRKAEFLSDKCQRAIGLAVALPP